VPISKEGANSQFSFFFICCASPIGGVLIAGLIILAQHKGNERISKAKTTIHSASRVVIEIDY
jgi:hypothetical protein